MPTGSMPLLGAIIGERNSELADRGTTIAVSLTMTKTQAAHGAFPQHRIPPQTICVDERRSCAMFTRASTISWMSVLAVKPNRAGRLFIAFPITLAMAWSLGAGMK